MAIRLDGTLEIADGASDIPDLLEHIRSRGSAPARSLERVQRRGRISAVGTRGRGENEHLDIGWRGIQQIFRERPRLATSAEHDEHAHFSGERAPRRGDCVGGSGRCGASAAVALERLAIRALLRVHVAEQRQALDRVAAAREHSARLRGRAIEESLRQIVRRGGVGRAGGIAGGGGGATGASSVNSESSTPRVERELLDRSVRALLAAKVRDDRELRILELEVDRQLELLRDVVRVDLERPLGRAKRTVVIAEVRENEAQVVMRLGVVGPRLNGATVRVPRVLELPELHQHEPDTVPRHRLFRLQLQHLPVRLQAERQSSSS